MKPTLLPLMLLIPACASVSSKPAPDVATTERRMIGLQEKFPIYDSNGDDVLSKSELKQAAIQAGVKDVTDVKVQRALEFYDFNRDGKISLREAQSGAVTGPEALIEKVH